jgi:hypothetical protein
MLACVGFRTLVVLQVARNECRAVLLESSKHKIAADGNQELGGPKHSLLVAIRLGRTRYAYLGCKCADG